MTLDASQCVEDGRNEQDNRSNNKTGCLDGKRDPLNDTHGEVDGGAHVIGLESADEGIKGGGCRTNAQEERDFDKEDDERADTGFRVSAESFKTSDYYSQAYHGKQDDPVEEEDIANAETEAQHHADDTSPIVLG